MTKVSERKIRRAKSGAKRDKLIQPGRSSISGKSKQLYYGYQKGQYLKLDFMDRWSSCQYDDIHLDIFKIEETERRLSGGYEPIFYDFEELLLEV